MGAKLPRIWILTEPQHLEGPIAQVRRALADVPRPAVGIQLRAKQATDRELLAWGHELRTLTRDRNAQLTVNGRADIAQRIGADGVHLGEAAIPIERLRHSSSAPGFIGASRHDREGLVAAQNAGADYAFLSPVFFVPGKTPPLGVEAFRRSIEGLSLPVFALGGVGHDHIAPLVRAGARGIAVRRAIYDAAAPAVVLDRLLDALDKVPDLGG